MFRHLIACLCVFFSFSTFAQTSSSFWTTVNEASVDPRLGMERIVSPLNYSIYELDTESMKAYLATAPMEFTPAAKQRPLILALPQPDGSMKDYEVFESPLMEPGLAARYPNMKTYAGRGVQDRSSTIRFDLTTKGFHAVVLSNEGATIIDNYSELTSDYFISYRNQDVPVTEVFHCGTTGQEDFLTDLDIPQNINAPNARSREDIAELYVYRFALACTGEWGASHGGDVETVMANFVSIISALNSIWERDATIRFVLVDNVDAVIFVDGFTDPYTSPDVAGGLLGQNVTVLNGFIGEENYDIGHVFTNSCTLGVGGIAGGGACAASKGAGVTCNGGGNFISAAMNTMAHEVGHQFTAGHTFNRCMTNVNGQPASSGSSAWEPGSGSTIMSYQGACGSDNIGGPNPYEYFNIGNVNEIYTHSRLSTTCAQVIALDHHVPTLSIEHPQDLYIPVRTSFELDMIANDIDGDQMTFNWEQYNTGPQSELGSPIGNAPAFRSYAPDANKNRYFPRIDRIVNAMSHPHEVLPNYSRDFTFLASIRDNNPGGSAVLWDRIDFKSTDTAGPFKVLTYNTDTTLEAGAYVEVAWDVANTDSALVNCQMVNIRLSIDGGYNYPIMLLENVPNDGSQFVTIPDLVANAARFRVEAANNIFFDLNNGDITIVPPSEPGFTAEISPYSQRICLPEIATIELQTGSLLGYNEELMLSVSGLPEGVTGSFDTNPLLPGTNTNLIIDATNLSESEIAEIEIVAISPTDTFYRPAVIDIIVNEFSDLVLSFPLEGAAGVAEVPDFAWTPSANADLYEIEIATNPIFGDSIVLSDIISGTEWTPPVQLNKTTLYYWRVRPINVCGNGPYTSTNVFHTETFSCSKALSNNVPLFVPGSVTTVESSYFITSNGSINDLNVIDVKLNFAPVGFLILDLLGPEGTEVRLFENNCGGTNLIDIGFDDEAASDIVCPPIGEGFYRPISPLSAFDGTNSEGEWKLKIQVTDPPFNGGDLVSWGIEMCSNASPTGPYIVNNEILNVRTGDAQWITNNFLLVQDDDNEASELEFTIVSAPENGEIQINENILEVGNTYNQNSIDAVNLKYVHNGNSSTSDFFTFTVNDGEGGFLSTTVFSVSIDDGNPPLGTKDLEELELDLFPNPAQNLLNLELADLVKGDLLISVFDVNGRHIHQWNFDQPGKLLSLNTTNLISGVYFLRLQTENALSTKKFTIQK